MSSLSALFDAFRFAIGIRSPADIIEFAKTVSLSGDVSSESDKIDFRRAPFLLDPLRACTIERRKIKTVVLAAPEQHGKTLIELLAVLYNAYYHPGQTLIVYPSDEDAKATNDTKYFPVLSSMPEFSDIMKRPFSTRKDRFDLGTSVIYFQGAGTKVVSKSCRVVVGDECAVYPVISGLDNIAEMRKRTRSFRESLSLFVSTPSVRDNAFWRLFSAGSRGFYTLRCPGCEDWTIRSCDIHNLQFESTYSESEKMYFPVPGSGRLVCPACKREILEPEKAACIAGGKYIHVFPERVELSPSFQFGVLASMLGAFSWDAIAACQLLSGRTADYADLKNFDNSWRGLPYQPRAATKQDTESVAAHFYPALPDPDDIEAVFLAADTQDTFSPCAVFAYTVTDCLYQVRQYDVDHLFVAEDDRPRIDAARREQGLPPVVTLLDLLDRDVLGVKPVMLLIDYRGHRGPEIEAFSRMRRNIVMYVGSNLRLEHFRVSDKAPKKILFDAKYYQAYLIHQLYSQHDKSANYLYLDPDMPQARIDEITCVKPDPRKASGNQPENWVPRGEAVHDVFDCLKMGYAALELLWKMSPKSVWRKGVAPGIRRVHPQTKKPQIEKKNPPPRRASWL